MKSKAQAAAEAIIRGHEQTNRLLPLAGGIPRPIEESDDHATVLALAWRTLTSRATAEAILMEVLDCSEGELDEMDIGAVLNILRSRA